jgi:hypothetical protein
MEADSQALHMNLLEGLICQPGGKLSKPIIAVGSASVPTLKIRKNTLIRHSNDS